ncbi:capsular polysaccharide synthesis protein [Gymnodinialimonas ceratoperidinii]|uniref:Capsular polysaccharide synthesis protein n=1 Tax=Gymnodinialimonas ceratoperidinii TaxID=2856823 RepID=A0A8F6YA37_9RHOB|nr:capsular polysaccharide synthesis protein [Gymnodinialimonas ceratoperidinii]
MQEMSIKRLSFFWAQGESSAPDVVKRCWEAWGKMNPEVQIVISDLEMAYAQFERLKLGSVPTTHQAISDIFRVQDMYEHGGVYIDCGVVPISPLRDWSTKFSRSGFFAFHNPHRHRSIESWFLYSERGNLISKKWLEYIQSYWSMPRRPHRYRHELETGLKGCFARARAELARRSYLGKQGRRMRIFESPGVSRLVNPEFGGQFAVYPYFWTHALFELLLEEDPEVRLAWGKTPKITGYKEVMVRHWRTRYDSMSSDDFATIVEDSNMQKLMLNHLPPAHLLDTILPPLR